MLGSLLEFYQTKVNHRLNEIMTVLTIFTSIFIPLTFIVGIYGMNFEHMPELEWRYGYVFVWLIMLITAASMLAFFRRRKWF
jgi:magnesium transporter